MIKIGTLGAARITPRALVYPIADEPKAMIQSIAARDRNRAERFAQHHYIPTVFDTYDDVITDERANALYNPLPISAHHEWSIKALRAGKHVLCEKSFASNAKEAREMADVANETGLVLMDAFHYRYHPLFIRAKQIFDSGELGEILNISAEFHVPVSADTGDIRMIYETGGGVTMDIGCYPLSWIRHISGEEPKDIAATAEVGPPQVDLMLETKMVLPSGINATTSGDMRSSARFKANLIVEGTKGTMTVNNPLVPQSGHRLDVEVDGKQRTELFDRRSTYGYQLDAFIDAIENGSVPYTSAEDAVKQMALIDRCYEAAGLPIRGLDL